MKLTYWYAPKIGDSDCYSVRAKTKKEAERIREEFGGAEEYDTVRKNTVEYKDGFDLLDQCMAEGRVFEDVGMSQATKEFARERGYEVD